MKKWFKNGVNLENMTGKYDKKLKNDLKLKTTENDKKCTIKELLLKPALHIQD